MTQMTDLEYQNIRTFLNSLVNIDMYISTFCLNISLKQ